MCQTSFRLAFELLMLTLNKGMGGREKYYASLFLFHQKH